MPGTWVCKCWITVEAGQEQNSGNVAFTCLLWFLQSTLGLCALSHGRSHMEEGSAWHAGDWCLSMRVVVGWCTLDSFAFIWSIWGPLIGKVKNNIKWVLNWDREKDTGSYSLSFLHFWLTAVFGLWPHWQHYVMKCLVDFRGLCCWGTPPI